MGVAAADARPREGGGRCDGARRGGDASSRRRALRRLARPRVLRRIDVRARGGRFEDGLRRVRPSSSGDGASSSSTVRCRTEHLARFGAKEWRRGMFLERSSARSRARRSGVSGNSRRTDALDRANLGRAAMADRSPICRSGSLLVQPSASHVVGPSWSTADPAHESRHR